MSESKLELNRRRVLGGIVTVGAAAAAAGAGTVALFSDTEESTNNTVSAGTLDLGGDGTNSAVTTVSVSNVAPGDSGGGTTSLKNVGTIDGVVDLEFSTPTNNEGANPDAETDTGSPGDLGSVLEVTVSLGSTTVRDDTFNNVFDGNDDDTNVPLTAGSTKTLSVDWTLPSGTGNDIQGDEVLGDITIELGQDSGQ
jgi:predicted ribosomally synthesized peptide with SipW-like signal peptide